METFTQKWTIYLSGPMTGIPKFNFPAFDDTAKKLRDMGYSVINPTELDDPHTRKLAMLSEDGAPDGKWGAFLGRDIAALCAAADEVLLLPGWENSRGSLLEALTARLDNILVSEVLNKELLSESDMDNVMDEDILMCLSILLKEKNDAIHQAHQSSLL
jgi:hypothetical protein